MNHDANRIRNLRSGIQGAGLFPDRNPLLGIRQHRHALRQIRAGRRRLHPRREIRRRGRSESPHRRHAHAGSACAVGPAQRRSRRARGAGSSSAATASAPAPSIPISFRTRNTNSARSAIPRRRSAHRPSSTFSIPSRSPRRSARAIFRCGSPTAPTIPARRASASASAGWKKPCAPRTTTSRPNQRLLVEYKPFEPAFYHTDIADWGMASHLARTAGPQARVLVDTGHHYHAQNIEQIVAWLLHTGLAGRIPLQRPPLRRRRPDPRLHRSLPDLPHLP